MTTSAGPVITPRASWRVAGSAVAASIAVHGALLAWLATGSPTLATSQSFSSAEALHVRIVASDLSRSAAIGLPGSAAVESEPTSSGPAPPDNQPVSIAPAREVAAALPPDTVPLLQAQPNDDAEAVATAVGGYHPRRVLTRAPQPLTDPNVSLPLGLGHAGEQRGIFSLFINASGIVDSVVRDGPTLSAPLEEAVVEVLRATRFSPGERDGVAVAALIRIEIVFDNQTPVAPPAPVIVSQQPL
jgi:hypothetical protein